MSDEERRSAPFATLERLGGFDAALCLECGRPGGRLEWETYGGADEERLAAGHR